MLNVVDLFAGPGGLSLGFELARDKNGKKLFNIICAVEKDPWACHTLRKNFPHKKVLEGDITKDKVKREIENTCKGKTDIVVGGPPCQSFSMIGPRSGNRKDVKDKNKYDGLYIHFIDIVRRLNPEFVLFENVKGILSKKNGDERVIDIITSELEKLGYFLGKEKKYQILNAADFGVPQTRERVFIIGNNMGIKNPVPEKTHCEPSRGRYQKSGPLPYVTLFDAIGDLPGVKPKKTITHIPDERKREIERYNRKVNSGDEKIKYRKEWKQKHSERIGKSGRKFLNFVRPSARIHLTHHTARPQMETDIKLFRGMKQEMTAKDVIESKRPEIKKLAEYIKYDMKSFRDKYKKQHWKRPCSTIFAHLQKDGNRFIHPDSHQARTLTPREAARVQSFPDDFFFEGSLGKKFQQIGNAVPPLLTKKIAESIFL